MAMLATSDSCSLIYCLPDTAARRHTAKVCGLDGKAISDHYWGQLFLVREDSAVNPINDRRQIHILLRQRDAATVISC